MALLFLDSFDHYATADITAKWTASVNNAAGVTQTIAAAGGRRGSGSLHFAVGSFSASAQCYLQKTLAPTDPTTCVIGHSFAISTAALVGANGTPLSSIRDVATAQVTLRVNPDLTLSVTRGPNNGTVLGTTTVALTANVATYVEWKVVIHPSAGTVEVRINGVSRLLLTGQNTRNTANTSWNGIILGSIDSATTWVVSITSTLDWDDLYVLDGSGSAPWNDFLGDCRVDARFPTAPGATTGWTPSAGANWAAVDDAAPNADTDYVAALTTPLTDTYVVQDAPSVGATIFGVQHCLSVKKMDASTSTVAPVIRHAGVDYPGANLSPSTAYAYLLQIAATNPGTAAPWVEADFNAAEFGAKRTT